MKKLTFTDQLVATQMHSKEGEIIDFVPSLASCQRGWMMTVTCSSWCTMSGQSRGNKGQERRDLDDGSILRFL